MRVVQYLIQRALLALAFLPPVLHAQTPPAYQQWPDCAVAFTLTTAGAVSARIDNTQVGCTAWAVQYSTTATGGGPAQSLRLESAVDVSSNPGAWGAFTGTTLTGANPMVTVGSVQSTFNGYVPWIRVALTAATNVSVRGNLYGWKVRPSAGAAAASDVNVLNFPATQPVSGTVGVNNFPASQAIQAADSPSIDAFSRLRVSNVETLFDHQQEYALNNIEWNTVTATGGTTTYNTTRSSTSLTTTATSSSRALIQTRSYFRYQPGKSQLLVLTGIFGNTLVNNIHRVGQFDDNNGLFLSLTGDASTPTFTRRTDTSGVVIDNTVAQTLWNLDPMNGKGPSGITLDFTKSQILIIDYQWLGVGRVRLGFDVGGLIYYAHEFRNANNLNVVYMRTANLPIRFENINTGAAAAGTSLEAICSTVMSEGGFEYGNGFLKSSSTAITAYSVSTVYQPVLCIRPSLLFNSKPNRARIIVESIEVLSSGLTYYALDYYGTPTGGTFVSVPGSPVQTDGASIAGTVRSTAITGGTRTATGFLGSAGGSNRTVNGTNVLNRMPITISFDGTTPDYVCVCAQSFSGSVTVSAAINWREIW